MVEANLRYNALSTDPAIKAQKAEHNAVKAVSHNTNCIVARKYLYFHFYLMVNKQLSLEDLLLFRAICYKVLHLHGYTQENIASFLSYSRSTICKSKKDADNIKCSLYKPDCCKEDSKNKRLTPEDRHRMKKLCVEILLDSEQELPSIAKFLRTSLRSVQNILVELGKDYDDTLHYVSVQDIDETNINRIKDTREDLDRYADGIEKEAAEVQVERVEAIAASTVSLPVDETKALSDEDLVFRRRMEKLARIAASAEKYLNEIEHLRGIHQQWATSLANTGLKYLQVSERWANQIEYIETNAEKKNGKLTELERTKLSLGPKYMQSSRDALIAADRSLASSYSLVRLSIQIQKTNAKLAEQVG
jgi:hypothetical protein